MGKIVLTAKDIDKHADAGIFELEIDNNIIVTDIGVERARERKVKLVRVQKSNFEKCHSAAGVSHSADEIKEKVRAAVIAKLGSTPENLDAIIGKVLSQKL